MKLYYILLLTAISINSFSYTISNYYSPENNNRPYRTNTKYIVLHTTEGPSKGSLNKLHKNGEAHYMITRNGHIYRIINRKRIAFHAGTSMWNGIKEIDNYSIGIEVAGYHNEDISYKQEESLKELIVQLQKIYNIPDKKVLTHSMVAYGSRNRWFKKPHRGRKRCGMLFALQNIREKIGLYQRPLFDPDFRKKRLINADPLLAKVLFGSKKIQTQTFKQLKEKNSSVIGKGYSAWDIARDNYNKKTTLYIFPNGKTIYGNQIKNWKSIPAGTKIKLNQLASSPPVKNIKTLGVDGNTATEAVGKQYNKKTTIYVTPDGAIKKGNTLKPRDFIMMPKNTIILVGYAYLGKITEKKRAYDICKHRWNNSSTFYRFPNGKLLKGSQVNEKMIPDNSLVFFEV